MSTLELLTAKRTLRNAVELFGTNDCELIKSMCEDILNSYNVVKASVNE